MIKIYHNPKCSKSRQALELLQARNLEIEVIPKFIYNATFNQTSFEDKI